MPSLNAAAERFADEALVIVGDEGDGGAFIATVADTVDAPRLEQLHRLGRGMVVLAIAERIADRLDFPEPRTSARHPLGLDFTAPIDAAAGISGGWSARDRARTMRVVADPDTQASDLTIPGHVHPVRVAERHADVAAAALELARLGGRPQAVALGTVLDRLGRPASLRETRLDRELARLPAISSEELHCVRLARRMTDDLVSCALPTRAGPFRAVGYAPGDGDEATVALMHGDPVACAQPLVYVHVACLLGDAFGSLLCGCRAELDSAVNAILAERAGVIIYAKLNPATMVICGRDGQPDIGVAAALLRNAGLRSIRLYPGVGATLVNALRARGLQVEPFPTPQTSLARVCCR